MLFEYLPVKTFILCLYLVVHTMASTFGMKHDSIKTVENSAIAQLAVVVTWSLFTY